MIVNKLYFFVEGFSDEIFIGNIIQRILPEMEIKLTQYAPKEKEKTIGYLKSLNKRINSNCNINYYFIADNDSLLSFPDEKIKCITKKYKVVKEQNIIIVENEIENWYLAGITNKTCRKLKLPKIKDTNKITKESFNELLKNKNRFDAYSEILLDYSLDQAKEKSRSFKYFMEEIEKYII